MSCEACDQDYTLPCVILVVYKLTNKQLLNHDLLVISHFCYLFYRQTRNRHTFKLTKFESQICIISRFWNKSNKHRNSKYDVTLMHLVFKRLRTAQQYSKRFCSRDVNTCISKLGIRNVNFGTKMRLYDGTMCQQKCVTQKNIIFKLNLRSVQ